MSSADEDGVVDAYLAPWRHGGSRHQLASVLEQLEFLAEMLGEGPEVGSKARSALVASLKRISQRVTKAR